MVTLIFELEDNDNLIEAWANVFMLWVPQCNLDFLIEEVVPKLMPLTSLKEKLSQRILSGEMLLEICAVHGENAFEKEQKLLNLALSFCDDINWKIRKLGANRLKRIIKHSQKYLIDRPETYDIIVEQLQELMGDEENFVKLEAFESILKSLPHIKAADFEERFAPIIKEIFEREVEEHEELQYSMASLCGELLFELKKLNMHHLLGDQIIEFYETLITSENEELRKRATYNLPFFFSEFYVDDEDESLESTEGETKIYIAKVKWKKYLDKLAHDEWDEIRITLAGCFHEIWLKVTNGHKPLGFWKRILFDFMKDENERIMTLMSKNMETYIKMYESETTADSWEDIEVFPEESKEEGNDYKNQERTPKGITFLTIL